MSISNTSSVPTLQGGFITLETIKKETNVPSRKSKIICTLGPACWKVEQLETLIDCGMNIARFNFSHGDHEGHKACLDRLREAARNKNKNVAVMLDTKGPEIRTGFFNDSCNGKINLVKNETIVLTNDYTFKGDSKKLACSYSSIAKSVNSGQQILVADGSLVLTVLSKDIDVGEVTCRIENDAIIGERKNMNLPGVVVDLPTVTEKDINDIVNFGVKNGVDFIAASFVRKASDVLTIRKLLSENNGSQIKIICKIENQEGLNNYPEILAETDSIMVARGDLGMEIPPSKVFLAQKYMIREANIAGKPVVTATQMLESMINNPRPTRAECSDVANAIYDGSDAVMLSGETANGPYFQQAVQVMARTCVEAESSMNFNLLYQSIRNTVMSRRPLSDGESLASSAVKTAIDISAKFIIALSMTGTVAKYVAKFRSGKTVLCLTPDETVARQITGLYKGSFGFTVDSLEDVESIITECSDELLKGGHCKVNDSIVVVCGRMPYNKEDVQNKVNTVQVRTIEPLGTSWGSGGSNHGSSGNLMEEGEKSNIGHLTQGINIKYC